MKVTILTVGSRGDVQPYVALGLGLQQAGYTVTLASNENFAEFVTSYGLRFHPLTGDAQAIVEGELGRASIESGRNFIKLAAQFRKTLLSVVDPFLRDCYEACKDADAVVHGLLGFFAQLVAEKHGIPSVGAYLQPVVRTSAFPNIAMPLKDLGGPLNLLTHAATEQIYWQAFRPIVNTWRTDTLGLAPYSLFPGPFVQLRRQRYPIVHGVSPMLIPKPRDYGPHLPFSGFWFLDEPNAWEPPDELVNFLAAGEPPVYVGFGSMSSRNSAETTRIVVDALQQAGKRGILLSGWGGMETADLPDSILPIRSAPHSWLFPRMAAVVHHGGMGTTSAGLRAGVPSMAVPFFGDQYFWGRRIAEIRAGAAPINRPALTSDRLAASIVQMTEDRLLQRVAGEIGRKIRNENGTAKAVQFISHQIDTQLHTL